MDAARHLTVGMAQMRVQPGQPAANLQQAVACIAEAGRAGCALVVLPECLDLGWADRRARTLAQPLPGPHADVLTAAARAHGIFVAAGLVERHGKKLYNAAVLIDDHGHIALYHRKINLVAAVEDLYAAGSRLAVAHTRLGVIGLNICADNLPGAPGCVSGGHTLAHMGAQIIVSPSAWAVPPDHDQAATPYGALWQEAYGQLAAAHGVPVVGVSSVGRLEDGTWSGWPVIGASLAMGGDGRVAAQAPMGENAEVLIVVELLLRHAPAKEHA